MSERRPFRRMLLVLLAFILPVSLAACGGDDVYEISIPAGTWQTKDSSMLDQLPGRIEDDGTRTLVFSQGDQLRVVNLDEVDHQIGLVTVRAGETITYTFNQQGEFEGACTLLAGDRIVVQVT